jgi:hypothetical protein
LSILKGEDLSIFDQTSAPAYRACMAVREIPIERPPGGSSFRQITDLGDEGTRRDYIIEIDWNGRAGSTSGATATDTGAGPARGPKPNHVTGAWRLSLLTLEGRALVHGRVLVQGAPLLGQLADDERPDGDLLLVTTGDDPPGYDALGVEARLIHLTGADLQAVIDARRGA